MTIINKRVEDLKEYENNPRHNDNAVEAVANSIKEFGFKVPIVIDKHNVIIAGHTRLKAAKQLGLETVPCVVADDLTEEQAIAFRLADNKTAELAEWDYEMLQKEIDTIDINMSNFGFENFEVKNDISEKHDDDHEDGGHEEIRCPRCGALVEEE